MRRALAIFFLLFWTLSVSAEPIYGAGPGSTTTAWNNFTFIDRSLVLPPGSTVTALALHNAAATTAKPKIFKRSPGSSTFTLVASDSPFSHPGGGYAWATLTTPFVVPDDGFEYLPGWWVSGTITRSVEPAQRASKTGDVTTSAAFTIDALGLPPMGAMIDSEGGGDPPPPPPPGTNDVFAVFPAQSNAQQMGTGPAFVSTYQSLVSGRTAELFNRAIGSSYLRPLSNYQHWGIGGTNLTNALTALKSKLAAEPNSVLRALIVYIGESTSNSISQVPAVNYMQDLSDTVAYIRQDLGKTPEQLPVLIVEQQMQPSPASSYPSWPFIQFAQRKATQDSDAYGYVPNSHLVSIADLQGTVDGGLHLGSANNTVLQERLGAAAAALP